MTHLTYLEAAVVGLVQGISEMFPVSSLGHNVLIPALVGGSWARDLNVATPESPYLAFIVGLHVATAIALLIYFWRDWVRIIGGFFSSIRDRRADTPDQKLAWLIILATIPVGLVGLKFEHAFRVIFGKPVIAGVFLAVNGVILIAGERFRTRASLAADAAVAAEGNAPDREGAEREAAQADAANLVEASRGAAGATRQSPASTASQPLASTASQPLAGPPAPPWAGGQDPRPRERAGAVQADRRLAAMSYPRALAVGSAQILALLAGISRDGVAMVAGMRSGLSREDAARFAFLLATPVILAAGALKVPDLLSPLGNGIRGQILLGSVLSGIGAYLSVRFLLRYLRTRTLTPFGIYCLIAGLASVAYLA
jgi:undecaprenyl-diphosphatase